MEPLVLFAAGLVVYCGYLALIDEIRDFRSSFAKDGAKCRRKISAAVRRAARPARIQGEGKGRCADGVFGRLQVTQAR